MHRCHPPALPISAESAAGQLAGQYKPQLTSLKRPEDEHFGLGVQTPSTTLLRKRLQAEVEMHLVRAGLSRRPAAQLTKSQTPVDRLSLWPEAHTLGLQMPPVSVLRSGLQRLRSMQKPVARSYKRANRPVGSAEMARSPSCDTRRLPSAHQDLRRQADLGQADASLNCVELGVACVHSDAGRLLRAREDETACANAKTVAVLRGGDE